MAYWETMKFNIEITRQQRNEIERVLSNWTNYLNSVPPTSDEVKVHRWFGASTSIVKKDDFNKKLKMVIDETRMRLNAAHLRDN